MKKKKKNRIGSAMLLTMFILASMIIVAMSGSYLVLMGIYAGSTQSQSIKAYYAAESGAERFLWELRKNGYLYPTNPPVLIFSDTLTNDSSYKVYFQEYYPLKFDSIGDYHNTKRSVEISI